MTTIGDTWNRFNQYQDDLWFILTKLLLWEIFIENVLKMEKKKHIENCIYLRGVSYFEHIIII